MDWSGAGVDSVPNRILHHGIQRLGEVALLGANIVRLLDDVNGFGLRNRVKPARTACTGRDHDVGR